MPVRAYITQFTPLHQPPQVKPGRPDAAGRIGGKSTAFACVEENRAAGFQILIELAAHSIRQERLTGRDRPIKQWEKRQLVGLDVHGQRLRRLDCRPAAQDIAQSPKARKRHVVERAVAGHDEGKPGFQGGSKGSRIRTARRRRRPVARCWDGSMLCTRRICSREQENTRQQHRGGRFSETPKIADSPQEKTDYQVDHGKDQRCQQQPGFEIDRRRGHEAGAFRPRGQVVHRLQRRYRAGQVKRPLP